MTRPFLVAAITMWQALLGVPRMRLVAFEIVASVVVTDPRVLLLAISRLGLCLLFTGFWF